VSKAASRPAAQGSPVVDRNRPVESGDPELEHHDRRTP